MLEARGLAKRYGPVCAVEDVSFFIEPGQCFGLLGPNGAGKTTTISMLVGVIQPDSGAVFIAGEPLQGDSDPGKSQIGFVPQELALYEEMSAQDNLRLFGALYGLRGDILARRIDEALELVGLKDRARDRAATFSGGMKRRLNLASALLHDPSILILDEPTVGVDPQSRNAIFENLMELNSRGKTILYTTHYMEEVERLCDRVAILDGGRIIANQPLKELYLLLPETRVVVVDLAGHPEPNGWLTELARQPGIRGAKLAGEQLRVEVDELETGIPGVVSWLGDHRCSIRGLATEQPRLEDVFLHLTGRSLRD